MPHIRPFEESDSIAELTALLHRAYAHLRNMGLNYTAVDQTPEVTARRIRGGNCFVVEVNSRLSTPGSSELSLHSRPTHKTIANTSPVLAWQQRTSSRLIPSIKALALAGCSLGAPNNGPKMQDLTSWPWTLPSRQPISLNCTNGLATGLWSGFTGPARSIAAWL